MLPRFSFFARGLDPKSIETFTSEINSSSDRSLAIVGGAFIEEMLKDAILCHLHRDAKITDELFRTSGIMGTFTSKIHLGKLIGIYGSETHRELTCIKDIRNRFAHHLNISDFKDQQISQFISNLKFGEFYAIDDKDLKSDSSGKKILAKGMKDIWYITQNKDLELKDNRSRLLLSIGVLSTRLAIPHKTRMPEPEF